VEYEHFQPQTVAGPRVFQHLPIARGNDSQPARPDHG
jgi:hypothetical protein